MIVELRQPEPDYPDLTAGQPYVVIGIEADDYALLNNRGQPYLYPHPLSNVTDATEPADWQTDTGDAGERYAYPAPLNTAGFFEDFIEGQIEAVSTFWHAVNQTMTAA
jgi:hypothetical protein